MTRPLDRSPRPPPPRLARLDDRDESFARNGTRAPLTECAHECAINSRGAAKSTSTTTSTRARAFPRHRHRRRRSRAHDDRRRRELHSRRRATTTRRRRMESVVARARRRARSPPARARARVPFSTSHESIAVGKGTSRAHTKGGTRGRVTTGGGGLFPPVAPVAATGWDGRSRARADVIDEGVVVGS